MRKISEKEIKKRGIKLKSEDLGRISASKSSTVISDAGKVIKESVNAMKTISEKASKSMELNSDLVKVLTNGKAGVQKVEIVGGDDKQVKQWRVRITGRDRDGLISEMIMEQV